MARNNNLYDVYEWQDSMRTIVLMKEHVEWFKAQPGVSVKEQISVGGQAMLVYLINATPAGIKMLGLMTDEGIPFNYCQHTATRYWPEAVVTVRFLSDGTLQQVNSLAAVSAEYKELIKNMLIPITHNADDLDRLVQCFTARDQWENQITYGRLHKMRRLIGG